MCKLHHENSPYWRKLQGFRWGGYVDGVFMSDSFYNSSEFGVSPIESLSSLQFMGARFLRLEHYRVRQLTLTPEFEGRLRSEGFYFSTEYGAGSKTRGRVAIQPSP